LGAAGPATAAEDAASRAKQVIAEETGLPVEDLNVGKASVLQNGALRLYKVSDPQGNVHAVTLDAAGNPASRNAVEAAVADANGRGFVGKLEKELADALAARADGPPINVVYWLADDATDLPAREEDETEGAREARFAAIRAHVAAVQQPVLAMLTQTGHQVIYRAEYGPVVVASGSGQAIRAMEAVPGVKRVYLERVHKPRLNVSKVVVQATTVHGRGIRGTGERVGVVEAGRIGAHPNLPAARRILCRPTASSIVSGHKTNVAGVIQSNHATNTGVAPNITLVDGIGADFSDAEMMAATDCVVSQGATAINMSFGFETNGVFDAFARYVDTVTYSTGRTIVVAVSNICGNRMGSPEIAFNALAVGSFSDSNTAGFADDKHSCDPLIVPAHSAFLDPLSPHSDREEPDVVAPGHSICTTQAGGGFACVPGTSFAAPHVTGAVGLLQDRLAVFNTQTERARAIIMASARHNIEGASRLSEKDGAGGLMTAAADRVLLNGQSWWFSTPGDTAGFPLNQAFAASAGQKVRVVAVWSHKMPLGNASTEPTSDLDLIVFRPGGALVASSTSFDNSYEIVEFTAPATGTYTARISNFRSSAGAEFIGLAVSRTNS
jgi:subtilisin family serine protease